MDTPLKTEKKRMVFLDGAMGTSLSALGADPTPASNLTAPHLIRKITEDFIQAGSDIVETSTFSATSLKFSDYVKINTEGVRIARKAVEASGRAGVLIAGSVGPTGRMLLPVGELEFEEAVRLFSQQIKVLSGEGADLLIIETMDDIQEMRAALIAAAETAPELRIIATMTFSEEERTSTGTPPEAAAAVMDSLGADVIGVNCSFGPERLAGVVQRMRAVTKKPLAAQANAGLPRMENGRTVFPLEPAEFASLTVKLVEAGASYIGGCCGTDSRHIKELTVSLRDLTPPAPPEKTPLIITSRTGWVSFGDFPVLIGERINFIARPALADSESALISEALKQVRAGADALDVCPGRSENKAPEIIETLARKTGAPLVLDSQDPESVSAAARIYPGVLLLNSISGEKKKLEELIPVAAKYGIPFIGLCTDDGGVALTLDKKREIAEKIIKTASEAGISGGKILIDPLALSASADTSAASVTLRSLRELGTGTVLGVSNVSSGMPQRALLNQTFSALAVNSGISALIANPLDADLVYAIYASAILSGRDPGGRRYLKHFSGYGEEFRFTDTLSQAVLEGDAARAVEAAVKLSEQMDPVEIINSRIVPALDKAGELYSRRVFFLPQLIESARCAEKTISAVEKKIGKKPAPHSKKILIATVEGDIHDIGKNLVALLLRNHSFEVRDMGVDVPSEKIAEEALLFGADIIALSSLMTTTSERMSELSDVLRKRNMQTPLMVGGAAVTEKFARSIGAHYARDAVDAVKTAGKLTA